MHNNTHHPENDPLYKGLTVNKGVTDLPVTNPYALGKVKKRKYSATEYLEGIRKGNIAMLGQAVTLIESSLPAHEEIAQEVIAKCIPYSGKSVRIGITGVPGAGKSTFIEALGMFLVRQKHRLAVLAIDPSSERSKGSILGDKTRMESLSMSPNAFIRPSPTAGSLGGVARKTRESIILCEAAGFDVILVETVGVGQSETAVHSMVDFFLLLQLAGTGDELQGIKRGIMEMADGIAINKSDGNNIQKSNLAKSQLESALHLFPMPDSGCKPKVIPCSAVELTGISEVWEMITDYMDSVKEKGYFEQKRNEQSKYWMYETINANLRNQFYNNPEINALLPLIEQQIFNRTLSSFAAAKLLLDVFYQQVNKPSP